MFVGIYYGVNKGIGKIKASSVELKFIKASSLVDSSFDQWDRQFQIKLRQFQTGC